MWLVSKVLIVSSYKFVAVVVSVTLILTVLDDKLKNEISDYAKSEEDVLIYAMFPQVARTYFENRDNNMKKESKVQTINIVF